MPITISTTIEATIAAPIVHSSGAAYGTSVSGRPSARLRIVTTYATYAATATTNMIHARFSSCVTAPLRCTESLT